MRGEVGVVECVSLHVLRVDVATRKLVVIHNAIELTTHKVRCGD